MVAPLKVGIAGLGTVGAEVVRLIEGQSAALSARCGRPIHVVAVTARSKAKKRGLDLRAQGVDFIDLTINRPSAAGEGAAIAAALECPVASIGSSTIASRSARSATTT